MNNYLNSQTIGITCGIGFLAYCIYFDRKRRNDPAYKEKVKARREREQQARESDDIIELPPINDKGAVERFFIKEIEIGEELIQAGEVDRAVRHLSYAVVMCPQPQQLLKYMREVLPQSAYTKLVENIKVANERVAEAAKRAAPQEDDVE